MNARVDRLAGESSESETKDSEVLGSDVGLVLEERDAVVRDCDGEDQIFSLAISSDERGGLTQDGEIPENGIALLRREGENLVELDALGELDSDRGSELLPWVLGLAESARRYEGSDP